MIREEKEDIHKELEMNDRAFIEYMLTRIQEYPAAYNALNEIYAKIKLHKFLYDFYRVRRFLKCNFSAYDSTPDLNEDGTFRFEFVSCPVRGECSYCNALCNPRKGSVLTTQQEKIMKLTLAGLRPNQVADKLFISPETVKKHKQNVLVKLGLHSITEFNDYAKRNQIFQ
jgi:DNA-binding CsgD family transcriptional regulator